MDVEMMRKEAQRVAARVSSKYPGVDADDIEQEIMEWAVKNKRTLGKPTYAGATLRRAFEGPAEQFAARERYEPMYLLAEYVYTPEDVRGLFAEFFQPDHWKSWPWSGEGVYITSKTGVTCSLGDLDRAYDSLKDSKGARFVAQKYDDQGEPLKKPEQKPCQRAMDTMRNFLNRRTFQRESDRKTHEGTGSREAMSNSAAQRLAGAGY